LLIAPANAGEYVGPMGSLLALEELMGLIHVEWEDQLFSYPQVDEIFGEGEIPDYSVLPMPVEGESGGPGGVDPSNPEVRPRFEAAFAEVFNFAAFGRSARIQQSRLQAQGYITMYNGEEAEPFLAIFSEIEDLGRFVELGTRREQEAFLLTLAHEAFMNLIASPEMREWLDFLQHPETCSARSAEELESFRDLTISLLHVSDTLSEELGSDFFRDSPYLAPFHRGMISFRRWLRENPETLVEMLVEMEGPWRRAFFSLLRDCGDYQFGNSEEEDADVLPLTPFAELLLQIPIAPARPAREETPPMQPLTAEPGSWDFEGAIEVELNHLPDSVSPEAYFDALLAVLSESWVEQGIGWNSVQWRWNPELSRELLRLNADGRYDGIWRLTFSLAYCRRSEGFAYCEEQGGPWLDPENMPEEIPEDLRLIHEDFLRREPHLPGLPSRREASRVPPR